jgi:hypothetical protein
MSNRKRCWLYCKTNYWWPCSSKRKGVYDTLIERGHEQLNYDLDLRNIVFASNGKTPADKVVAVIDLDEQINNQEVELEE